MKIKILVLVLVMVSCKQKSFISQTSTFQKETKATRADTIFFYNSKGEKQTQLWIIAKLTREEIDKDSIRKAFFEIELYKDGKKTNSNAITIDYYNAFSDWYGNLGLTNEQPIETSFIKISCGYPACGYSQNNYLYFQKNKTFQLVHQWQSYGDSGWGSWLEFNNPEKKANPTTFYCKTVSFEPSEDETNDEIGNLCYRDSIVFRHQNKHWQKQLLTIKDSAYYKKEMNFKTFHNLN